jgi:hypothetical protein
MAERDVQAEYFPDFPTRAFAYWFTGKVRLPQGDLLQYVHGGFKSIYERDIFLHFENGILKKEELVMNDL